ncbi:hypothetical protein HJG53_03090 [Sphingomonas sp. ID1715]|uniref:hypothetical protein n=1 Tax=Sphingomonas sp. ID1715 TaxID=1656898 RepID=UPI0014885243|nr:hypothetical protein [Sphingomonas sp. ID1715]NNM75892.1 hypothetical protein [Sphingomonas sp. ID1715]
MILASKWARLLAGGTLAAACAGAAIAGPVVVRSTGPSAKAYPAGRQLADNAQVNLKAGDTLILLDARGTRTLSGPGNFPAIATGTRAGVAQTASRIIANQSTAERRGGAVRGGTPTGDTRSPNLWLVDLSKSGTVCVADTNTVRVWRAATTGPAEVKVSAADASGTIAMAPGAAIGDWPKALPVADGKEYSVSVNGNTPAKIRFVTVPVPASLEDTASTLIAKGCKTQLDLLIATTGGGGSAG